MTILLIFAGNAGNLHANNDAIQNQSKISTKSSHLLFFLQYVTILSVAIL